MAHNAKSWSAAAMPRLARAAAAAASVVAAGAEADAGAGRRLGFGMFTAAASSFDESRSGGFMPGMVDNLQGQGSLPMPTPDQQQEVSQESADFIAAMIKAFLNRQQLQPGELDCIVAGSKTIGGNVGRIGNQLGMILQGAFDADLPGVSDAPSHGSGRVADGAGSIEDMVSRISGGGGSAPQGGSWAEQASTPAPVVEDQSLAFFFNGRRLQMMLPAFGTTQQAQPSTPQSDASGGVVGTVPVAMEIGYYMEQIVSESRELVGKCVHSDAKRAFQLAGRHMHDLTYMTGHVLGNGAEIAKEFADSVMAYEEKDPARFGTDVGIALRKVFLSNNAQGGLPEGMPGEKELAQVTAGYLKGFFGPGTALKVKFSRHPESPAVIDMNTCVSENIRFFQQMWASTMYLFAQKAVGMDKSQTAGAQQDEVQFGTMVAVTMMELPGAMDKCNIDPDHKKMILDSLKSFGSGMHMKFNLPRENVEKKVLVEGLAQTVKDWSAHRWSEFGFGLGNVFRQSTVAYFPQKYTLGPDGLLQQLAPQRSGGGAALVAYLFPATLVAAAAAVVMHRRRRIAGDWAAGLDVERGSLSDEAPVE